MPEQNVIEDVRAAKVWVNSQSSTLAEHFSKLAAIERDFLARSGTFVTVPRERSEEVRRAIESAQLEPGKDFLSDTRKPRSA